MSRCQPKPVVRRTPWGEYNVELTDGTVLAGPFAERSWAAQAKHSPAVRQAIAKLQGQGQ